MRKLWEKDLDCTLDEGMWMGILSNTEKYVREARSKFIQYKIIHRYYYTPTRLNKMKLIKDYLCCKCEAERGTYLHAMWECPQVFPLWKNVLEFIGNWLQCILPTSPRLCLPGDRTTVPNLNKFKYRILKSGLLTCARLILRCWKEPQTPTMEMWKIQMMETAAYEKKMLMRLNGGNEATNEQWESFRDFVCVRN